MNKGVLNLAALLAVACAMSVGCGSDDDSSPGGAGAGGKGGSSGSAGKGGSSGSAGKGGSAGKAGSQSGGAPSGGSGPNGGRAGSVEAGAPQAGGESAGSAGIEESGGEAGMGAGGASGAGGEAGAATSYTPEQVARGQLLVRSVALCGGCHTSSSGSELAGNATFPVVPAPNLTPDATGLGEWSDAEIINAIKNGIDDEGRQLNAAMPYWLFHNMTDADATAIVAFLRSLTPVSASIGTANPAATPVTPLSPAAFPVTSLPTTDPNYAKAQKGQYLLSGVAQCVKCHSPAAPGVPTANFFSGATPSVPLKIFASNITPDNATGIGGWTAQDVATALKLGVNKANVALCGSMPSGSASAPTKGYGGLSDEDALAIGVYLTTIPAVSNAVSAPALEPACP